MIATALDRPPASPRSAAAEPSERRARLTRGRRRADAIRLAFASTLIWASAARAEGRPEPPAGPPALSEPIPKGSVLSLLGRDVTGPRGEVVAQIVNLLVDASGQPRAAILDYGGFLGVGKRRIAVVWQALRFAPGKEAGSVTLLLNRDQLTNFPEYKPDAPVAAVPPQNAPSQPTAGAPSTVKE